MAKEQGATQWKIHFLKKNNIKLIFFITWGRKKSNSRSKNLTDVFGSNGN